MSKFKVEEKCEDFFAKFYFPVTYDDIVIARLYDNHIVQEAKDLDFEFVKELHRLHSVAYELSQPEFTEPVHLDADLRTIRLFGAELYKFPLHPTMYPEPDPRYPPRFVAHSDLEAELSVQVPFVSPEFSMRCRRYQTLLWVSSEGTIRLLGLDELRHRIPHPKLVYRMLSGFDEPAIKQCAIWFCKRFNLNLAPVDA